MDNVISSVYGTFERFLRYVYPGFLFLLLLYFSQPPDFCLVNTFGGNIWFLFVAGLIIGMVLQLIQAHVITEILSIIFKLFQWDVNYHPNYVTWHIVSHCQLKPKYCFLKRLARKCFDSEAEIIELRCKREKNHYSNLDALWARFHALSVTGWLTIVFWCLKSESALLGSRDWNIILGFSLVLLIAAIILFMRLTRVRHSAL